MFERGQIDSKYFHEIRKVRDLLFPSVPGDSSHPARNQHKLGACRKKMRKQKTMSVSKLHPVASLEE